MINTNSFPVPLKAGETLGTLLGLRVLDKGVEQGIEGEE